jgi:hypothetical protein
VNSGLAVIGWRRLEFRQLIFFVSRNESGFEHTKSIF